MTRNMLNSIWINRVARILLGAIFIYASYDKLLHPLEFARIIDAYQLMPEKTLGLVAAILPFLELICGILLVIGVWVLPSLIWTGLLLIAFMIAMAQAYFRGLSIDCGCFSVTGSKSGISPWTVLRDVLILLVWLKAFLHYKTRSTNRLKEAIN